ncbi:Protein FAR1-RELATED SEQUENCE 5 [Rhynchospora pubera]|uniref:Protein FAR1-RELATED SEQUENCE 5 n=1 Tax=Rhynchospora pubera TaxID=906938 RepID=A0AAV8D3H5_9POAL|nr:Protein FAR1-RELATED SEQUENCE 5 [Rhynchospora pubera]
MVIITEANEGAPSTDDIEMEHLDLAPFVGKEFITIDDAREFYNSYAYRRGFSIREAGGYTSAKSGEVTSVRWLCSNEGFSKNYKEAQKALENSTSQTTLEKERAPIRTGCKARFRIRFEGGVWKVSVFEDDHNHPLVVSPSKKRSLRSHRSMGPEDKEIIKAMNVQNIESAKIHEYLGDKHGGKKNLRFKKKDVANVITVENQQLVDKNVEATLVYFQKKQQEDPEFFYDVEVDEGGQLKNLFWVDGRARRAFQEFGDVVTFDTTYRTNRFLMPLAPFIGVNHHRRCVFFGIAMLRSEHIAGFVWLFKTWVKAMYGKKPRAIITDQDPAMRIAIKEVFPNTVHRCCQWHVMRKAREHLGAIYNLKPAFKKELKRVINHSNTVSEFEEKWWSMLDTNNLMQNRHLKNMYEARSEWVPAYFRDYFFAGMSSSQRSESMNAALKIWTNSHSSMYRLFLHLEKMVEGNWQKESDEDIASLTAVHKWSTLIRYEKDAFEFYTSRVMEKFKNNLKNTQLGRIIEIERDAIYEVSINYHPAFGSLKKPQTYEVHINKMKELVCCSCKGFEFEGLLCSHALKVMHHVDMERLPTRYILKRWCKDANVNVKRSQLERCMDLGTSQEQETLRISQLKPQMMKLLTKAAKSSDAFKTLQEIIKSAEQQLDEVDTCSSKLVGTCDNKETQTSEIGTATSRPSNVILDPPVSQCKGKRKNPQRFKAPSEPKKPRKCGICGSTKGGHNSRTCPMKKDGKSNKREKQKEEEEKSEEEEEGEEVDDDEYEDLSS